MNNSFDELIYQFSNNPEVDILKKIYKIIIQKKLSFNTQYIILFNLTLLHVKQPYETMKYILDRGGDPNSENDSFQLRPIHFQKEYKTIKLLVDRGASPNPTDIYNFSPLYWQKDPESVRFLIKHNPIINNIIYKAKEWPYNIFYNKMLIEGGYDPYNEYNISITPVFLQRDRESLDILLDHCYMNDIPNYDIAYETPLFKASVNKDIIEVFDENNQNLDHQNILGNTALHVQSEIINVYYLLKCGANHKIKNNDGLTPYEYHRSKYNVNAYSFIGRWCSARMIQRMWRRYWFFKTYVPPKFYRVKKSFMEDFKILPPSECGIFPGGIEYQNAYEDFRGLINAY